MDYTALLKRSWAIVKKHRWLWWLGLLATLTEGGGSYSFPDFSGGIPDFDSEPMPGVSPAATSSIPDSVGKVLGVTTDDVNFEKYFIDAWSWATTNWEWLVLIAVIFIAIYIAFLYISYAAKAGLILAVEELEEHDKELGFGGSFSAGRKYSWSLFFFSLLIALIVLAIVGVVGVVFALPIIAALVSTDGSVGSAIFAAIWGLIGLFAFIVLALYLTVVKVLSERTLVLENKGILAALEAGQQLVRHQFGNSVVSWLVSLGIGFVWVFASIIIYLPVLGILALIGFLFHTAAGATAAVIYAIVAVILFIILSIWLQSVYVAYFSTYWTLVYRAIRYISKKHHAHAA